MHFVDLADAELSKSIMVCKKESVEALFDVAVRTTGASTDPFAEDFGVAWDYYSITRTLKVLFLGQEDTDKVDKNVRRRTWVCFSSRRGPGCHVSPLCCDAEACDRLPGAVVQGRRPRRPRHLAPGPALLPPPVPARPVHQEHRAQALRRHHGVSQGACPLVDSLVVSSQELVGS